MNQTPMLRWNMSSFESDDNNEKILYKMIGDQTSQTILTIQKWPIYIYADPLNLENTNVSKTIYTTLINKKKMVSQNSNKCH